MPIYEFVCQTSECPENTDHFPTSHRVKELLCKSTDEPVCEVCGHKLKKIMSACPGYVIGTNNPCKC